MTFTVEATYENGVLKPAEPLPLREHEKVELVIRTAPSQSETRFGPSADARQEALRRLIALNLPVADWEQMEQDSD